MPDSNYRDESGVRTELGDGWTATLVLIPRFGLKMTRRDVERQLILPGRYEVRQSARFGRKLYRDVRP